MLRIIHFKFDYKTEESLSPPPPSLPFSSKYFKGENSPVGIGLKSESESDLW